MEKQSLLDSLSLLVENSKSFQSIMADGKVTEEEIKTLAERICQLMSQVEEKLSADDFKLVSELITEMSVFYVVSKFNEKVR